MIFAYVRVSTQDQNTDSQVLELKKHGYDELIIEKASGAKTDRPKLQGLIEKLRKDDTLLVYRLDRLGRSLKHLIELVEVVNEKEANLVSITDAVNTKSASGKLIFHIFGAIADFERELIRERTMVGLKAARARGRLGGRPKGLSEAAQRKARAARKLYDQEEMTTAEIMKALDIGSRRTLYNYLKWAQENPKI